MLLPLGRYVLFRMVAALAVAAGAVLGAPRAAAQPQPTVVLSPASGPCDGMVNVAGSGFLGRSSLRFYLVQPGTADISAEFLNSTYVNNGTFRQLVWLDKRSCEAAALDSRSGQATGHLTFAFTAAFTEGDAPLQPGDRIPDIIGVGQYAYTTTITLKPQPTLVLSPSSGPCDASVEVTGTRFVDQPSVRLYVVKPGTADVSVGSLNSGILTSGGSFTQVVSLHHGGCEAAVLDSQAGQPTGKLTIAASYSFPSGAEAGEGIPNIVAVAQYAYTTAVAQPQPTMVLSPASGPCDATVEVTGSAFPASTGIYLFVGAPKSDGSLGKLASLVTDSAGGFATTVSLGSLGCRAAQLEGHYPGQLSIGVDLENRTASGPGIPPILTQTHYEYTTGSPTAQALPSTGSGPEERSTSPLWFSLAAALAGMGLVLVAGSLYRSKRLRS
jgi:hypothetical protein